MRAEGVDKYANATNTAQTTMQSQRHTRESETPNVPLHQTEDVRT